MVSPGSALPSPSSPTIVAVFVAESIAANGLVRDTLVAAVAECLSKSIFPVSLPGKTDVFAEISEPSRVTGCEDMAEPGDEPGADELNPVGSTIR